MKALYKMRPGADNMLYRKDAAIPSPGPDEVRIKVFYAGICGTDHHILSGSYSIETPRIIGHEFSGTVDALGSSVTEISVGDRVVSRTSYSSCGRCTYCNQGLVMLCKEKKALGSQADGCFAEYLVMKAACLYIIPPNISMQEATLCEPLACSARIVIEMQNIKPGSFVYVSGPGIIGQFTAQLVKLCGAHVTFGGTSDDADRLSLAKQLGADEIIDVNAEDVLRRTKSITHGEMFDAVFECSGSASAIADCLDMLKKQGSFNQIGLFGKPITIDMDKAVLNELTFATSYSSEPTTWDIVMQLIAQKKISFDGLISGVFPFDHWKMAMNAASDKANNKILIRCCNEDDIGSI